jgi:hypothetical protein
MDCEKFDQHVIDELYEELDELTHAALKRHVEGCSRCAAILSGLRATRDVGILPIEEPSDDLEARILDAVAVAQKKAPWPRKVLRGLAWAGSHAMRPQLAMAALFFLVIGSSLLLLRAKPGTGGLAPVRVTERGAPAIEAESPVAAATASPTAAPPAAMAAAAPIPDQQQGIVDTATVAKDKAAEGARPSDKDAARLALADARTVRDSAGCAAAVSKYDEIGARFPGSGAAADAMWDAATCYRSMGDAAKARELYLALESVPSYRQRAEQEVAGAADNNLGNSMNQVQVASRAAAAGGKMPAAAAPMPAAAAPPAATAPVAAKPASGSNGSGRNAVAAPKKAAADTAAGF